jgi:hypothetical protein
MKRGATVFVLGGCVMRSLLVVCLVACVALVAGTANAGGQISDNTLAQMGLAGLQTMSDVQGTEVRGMGFYAVIGGTSARGLGACASSSYVASGSKPVAGGAVAGIVFGNVTEVLGGCGTLTVVRGCGIIAVANSSAGLLK